jgi:hypothetical protein
MPKFSCGLLLAASIAGAQTTTPPVDTTERWPTGTFSILAYDPETGEIGGAVQSRVFSGRQQSV